MSTPQASQFSLLTNFTGSPSAILASVKRKGLPQINQDEMKMQLASPTAVYGKSDEPMRLHLVRTSTPNGSKPADETAKNSKKKGVVFNDEREYLETPRNNRRASLRKQSEDRKVKKGILIKHKKNSSVAVDIRNDIAIEKSRNSSPMLASKREEPVFDSSRLEAMLMGVSDKGPASFRDAVQLEDVVRFANPTPKKISKEVLRSRVEESNSTDKSSREDPLDEIRKKLEQDFSSDKFLNGKVLSPGFSSPSGLKEELTIFKSTSLKKDVFPTLRTKYQLEPKPIFNPSPSGYIKNNNKVGIFNVGGGESTRDEMSSFRSILNGSTLPSEIARSQANNKGDMIKMTKIDTAGEDRILTLENPYENFIKKTTKVSGFGAEASRSNFMMANANNILKRDVYKSESGLPFVPKLDLFPQYKMAVTNPYNSPRK